MTRTLLFAAVLLTLAGCRHGRTAADVYQARGVIVALSVPGQGVIAGELLAVEAGAYLLDAVDQVGTPTRVVRVPFRDIAGGAVYSGASVAGEVRSVRVTPLGLERIARLRAGGVAEGQLGRSGGLALLSRFPYGMPDQALARLLDARVQTEVAGPDFAPARSTL